MASDLLSIASSGARAARAALDVSAQNIANASTEGYVRRSLNVAEVSGAGGPGRLQDNTLSGVRIVDIRRNVDSFRQEEVRRTSGDLQRANAELSGLRDVESAVEQSGVFDSIVELEAALQQLTSDATDPSRRAAVIGAAETLAGTFNIAASQLEAVGNGLGAEVDAQVGEANTLGAELARVNYQLARAKDGSSGEVALLDQRDLLLERLSAVSDITTQFQSNGVVNVSLGSNPSRSFVQGDAASTLTSTVAADGSFSFAIDGQAVGPASGSLAGIALAQDELGSVQSRLDTIAAGLADTVNNAQAAGVALDGTAGQPIFAGTTAATLRVVMTDGAGLATAPAGAAAGSLDPTNLDALRQSLTNLNPAEGVNGLLLDVSSKISGRNITQSALETIAASARATLNEQSGVDLDQEAADLIRYQQAFQASGRAMQVAGEIFETLLGIR